MLDVHVIGNVTLAVRYELSVNIFSNRSFYKIRKEKKRSKRKEKKRKEKKRDNTNKQEL